MVDCSDEETQQHLLMDWYRAKEAWSELKAVGIDLNVSFKSVMYGIMEENSQHSGLLQPIYSV